MGAVILAFTGTKTSGTNGADAVVQYNTNTGSGGTGLTVTLAAFADSNNRPVAFFAHRADEATTPEAGYTELYDGNIPSPVMGYEAEWHATTADTTPSATWATSGVPAGGFALEIAAAPTCTYDYQRTLTVQSGQVSNGPHTNFPMLVSIASDNNLRTVAYEGNISV